VQEPPQRLDLGGDGLYFVMGKTKNLFIELKFFDARGCRKIVIITDAPNCRVKVVNRFFTAILIVVTLAMDLPVSDVKTVAMNTSWPSPVSAGISAHLVTRSG
jgi:hypothetical protein